jgi:hypothetical protein
VNVWPLRPPPHEPTPRLRPPLARCAALPAPGAAGGRAAPQLVAEVAARFVRLSGILFDRVNAEEWPAASSAAFSALSGLLAHPGARELLARQPRADAAPLHLVVTSVFSVHNCWEHAGGHRAGGAGAVGGGASARLAAAGHGGGDGAQRLLLRSRALAAAFRWGPPPAGPCPSPQ